MKYLNLLIVFAFGLPLVACQIDLNRVPTQVSTVQANIAETATPATSQVSAVDTMPTSAIEPKLGGQITMGLVGKLDTVNPLTDLGPTLQIISPLLYQPLNQIDPLTAQPLPGLASLPEVSAGGLTVTFTLLDEARDSLDVTASVGASIWPVLDGVRGVAETADLDRTAVSLTVPNCALVDELMALPILASETAEDAIPSGTGPFQVADWDLVRQELRLVRNAQDSGESPWLESVSVRFFENEALALAALQAGLLDILPSRIQPNDLPSGYQNMAYPAPLRIFASFNHQDEIMRIPTVRQALSMAVNRVALLTALSDQGQLTPGPLHPNHWAADSTLAVPPYDMAQAASHLDEADLIDRNGDGWRDLPDGTTWLVPIRALEDNVLQSTIAYHLADAYRQIGIYSRAELVSLSSLLDDLLTLDYQMAVYGLPVRPALDQRSYWHSDQIDAEFGLNLAAYTNPDVDTWLDEANQLPGCDPADRLVLYQQLQHQLVADQAMDFLLVPNYYLIVSDTLHGLSPGPFAPFTWNADAWYLE